MARNAFFIYFALDIVLYLAQSKLFFVLNRLCVDSKKSVISVSCVVLSEYAG